MRTPEPTPIPALTPPPVEDGELIPPVDVFPTPLPLDPLPSAPEVLAAAGAEPWSWLLAAVLLLAIGGAAWWFGREVQS